MWQLKELYSKVLKYNKKNNKKIKVCGIVCIYSDIFKSSRPQCYFFSPHEKTTVKPQTSALRIHMTFSKRVTIVVETVALLPFRYTKLIFGQISAKVRGHNFHPRAITSPRIHSNLHYNYSALNY